MSNQSTLSSLSSLLPFLLEKPRWPQHLGQLATRVGYTALLLEITSNPSLLEQSRSPLAVRWLLHKGASVNAMRDGFTPLMNICRYSENPAIKEESLMEMVQDIYHRSASFECLDCTANPELACDEEHSGRSPLLLAANCGRVILMDWLLKNGANPQVLDARGMNVLSVLIHRTPFSDEVLDWWLACPESRPQIIALEKSHIDSIDSHPTSKPELRPIFSLVA